ncbi:M15 family metallopeptidase [Pseudomonas sp.]|uniref:M15 family metallopeptidase n=1 Tax=Pseudomonas sp. TaxID=306 RepID=UPI002582C670|nr:M15 family metallopeptidase [Pseudomonas sp.]
MNNFKLSRRSLDRMQGIHPDLAKVVMLAIQLTEVDFGVTEGLRTIEKQREYVAKGASKTMNSRHLTGHAVDLAAYIGSEMRWDWPLYYKISDAMKRAANSLGVPIVWGGDWKTFKDGPHFELDRKAYP